MSMEAVAQESSELKRGQVGNLALSKIKQTAHQKNIEIYNETAEDRKKQNKVQRANEEQQAQ